MHSRIFQVSMEPIEKDYYICESDYWESWFLNSIADYVNDDCDRTEDIQWLKDCCDNAMTFGQDKNGDYFIINSKTKYFEKAFERFKLALDKIKDTTIDDFAQGIFEVWQLKNAHEDRFGFYADVDGELMTFDAFVRLCATGEKYYIGGTIDYHC